MQPKVWQRLSHVLGYGSRQAILLLGNAIIALLVIKNSGEDLWGGFVKVFVILSFTSNIINWGNRDYLLRQFSQDPSQVHEAFWESLLSRSSILALGMGVVLFLLEPSQRFWGALWMVAYFGYQSMDVFIIHHRRYAVSALVEFLGLVSILVGCLIWPLSIDNLVMIFAISFVLRAILLVVCLPNSIWEGVGRNPERHFSFYSKAKWFFLIGFSGLLQSRIDLYAISLLLSDEEVGRYQIMISLLILVQTSAGIIMTPFSVNLMRQSFPKMVGISRKMTGIGVVISLAGVVITFSILRLLYDLEMPSSYLLWAVLLVFPIFSYLTWIFYLYGINKEMWVMYLNFGGAVLNLLIIFVLLPKYGILGALISSALVQCSLAIIFPILVRANRRRHPTSEVQK